MKSLVVETIIPGQDVQPAEKVMETVSMVTRAIRHEMRKHRPMEMSMQQFRSLGILQRHPGSSLMTVAGHLGLTTASACKLIDALAKQGLVSRAQAIADRRKVVLNVTEAGMQALDAARIAALGRLAEILDGLDENDLTAVLRAMDVLGNALGDEGNIGVWKDM